MNVVEEIKGEFSRICLDTFRVNVDPDVNRADPDFGDYSSNVAFLVAARFAEMLRSSEEKRNTGKIINVGHPSRPQSPRDYATEIVKLFRHEKVEKLEVAGPGFINITLKDEFYQEKLRGMLTESYGSSRQLKDKEVVVEYSDPNPFKILHAGHLYTSVVGDAIANLLENAGAKVHRVNFGGDVGLHVGKTMWAILELFNSREHALQHIINLSNKPLHERIGFITICYIEGNNRYETDEKAKEQIVELNRLIYKIHEKDDNLSNLAQIYWTCREWSYQYFDEFYAFIGSRFEKYYPESQTAPLGLATVRQHVGDVYEESEGAVVFKGEKYGLHTRVFINSQGLPTYEAKDVGLIMKKWQDYNYDRSIIITGNDIVDYMKVVLKSVEQFEPKLVQRTTHLTHGIVKLSGGVKMSSRLGNILGATDIINFAAAANQELTGKDDLRVTLGAVKYSFLKQRMGGDIIYDPAESVSIEGNSGPYLQYAHVRAISILKKSTKFNDVRIYNYQLNESERCLVRKMTDYEEVISKATNELSPHHICTYLYELAQEFNRFYEKNRVLGSEREIDRITLVSAYVGILASGLKLLGIEAPEKM